MRYSIARPTTKYYKNETGYRYYKYDTWTQPVLTSNGTMGGSSFACSASNWELAGSGTIAEPYAAFDNNPNTYWRCGSGITTGWFQFYNPTPIKVSSIKWGYFYSYPLGGNIQGSNDGSNWEMLSVWDNNTEGDFIIRVNSDNFYKYYRINCNGTNLGTFHCVQFTITAVGTTYKEVSSSENYDFSETYTYAEEVNEGEDYDFSKEVLTPYSIVRPTTKYYKNKTDTRYYKYDTWTQPKLTSDTSYGVVTYTIRSGENDAPYLGYKALDGDATTWWEVGASTYSGYLQWVLPERIIVKGISISVRTGDRPNITVQCYTSSDKTTAIGNSITTAVAGETKVVSGIPANGVTTDTLYFDCSSTEDYFGISEIVIDATLTTYHEVASTDDYDFSETYTYAEEVSENDDYDFSKEVMLHYVITKEMGED